MIVLFNLNRYVGGGETITIRIAQYLHDHTIPYALFTFSEDCYLSEQARNRNLKLFAWPVSNDSVAYMNEIERATLVKKVKEVLKDEQILYPFTCCLRDLYNSLYIFSRFKEKKITISTAIYHPEDVYYLSSLSLNKKNIIEFNRNILLTLADKDAVLFPNFNALKTSFGNDTKYTPQFIPLPILIPDKIPLKILDQAKPIKIVCISRFVSFKIAAVLAIVRFARKNKGYELSLIGYGIYRFVLSFYIKIHHMKNVKIFSGIGPDQLDQLIDQADIGYAQGTSILEIAKRGMPVIIAPYSNILDIFNKDFLCMGVFGERNDFNYGDYRSNGGPESVPIDKTIERIVNNYTFYRDLTVTHAKRFSTEVICKQIHNLIINSKYSCENTVFNPPKAPLVKKALKKLMFLIKSN